MTKDQLEREKNYRISIHIAKKLLKNGTISEKEYKKIDTKLTAKYRPVFGTI